ncbi:MAG: amidohydrolase family protein [Ilumatobacteraceae bacterium]|nr:amidohydrolase family protein [Ilumatobacteraceae bacterium]
MDLVLRNAHLFDGTGSPGRVTDVGVLDGKVAAIGDVAAGDEEVDLDGLVLAPGFIDPHTHYDAQVLWDRDLTPSCWHGVTTVIMGNCGFGIAPTRAADRETIMRTLENVEGMPFAALSEGIPWDFTTFPEYLDAIESGPIRLNVAAMLGHTPLRTFVMGGDASERAATAAEIATMADLVSEALSAGAVGFSSSRSETHLGAYGRPVPSRLATRAELQTLVGVLGSRRRGTFEATWGPDFFVEEFAELAAEVDRPITWAALLSIAGNPDWANSLTERSLASEGTVHPQIACRPIVVQVTLADPSPLANVTGFDRVLELPRERRAELYADPEWRREARRSVRERWGDKLDQATIDESSLHAEMVGGLTLSEIGRTRGGVDSFDVMLDLAIAENLETRFRVVMINDDEDQVAELLQQPRFLLGLSDAGAHTSQLCDANYATYLLGYWVRERGVLTLEEAVRKLTSHPAEVYGIVGRGVVAVGAWADLVVFDPSEVGAGPAVRVTDLPGGADRLVSPSVGIRHIWVNGEPIRRDGDDLAERRPGRVLRDHAS